ncbi:MAG: hypothetical protein FJ317_00035 [SAR202 cluster bacterium]|nr:hypothetical protein [SAR202 cluster bacterium]
MVSKARNKLRLATTDKPRLANPNEAQGSLSSGTNGHPVFYDSCPRCTGTRYLDRDHFGWFLTCVACGCVSYPLVKEKAKKKRHLPDVMDADQPVRRARRVSFSALRLV